MKVRELAQLPVERKLWSLRKFYAGNGGCLPPTDPRIMNLTDDQIELDVMHIELDRIEKDKEAGNQSYSDEGFEEYEKEVDNRDKNEYFDFEGEVTPPSEESQYENEEDDGEWEDVEIDDL